MLISLYVKNIAIIKEVEIIFKEGLNILTGETGAGKSIIIDSINIALGSKVNKDIIRKDKEFALVELVFETRDIKAHSLIKALGIELEDKQVIISRKIMRTRSICRVNGETVSMQALKELGSYLIDIHGQHDNRSLLSSSYHLDFVDEYAKEHVESLLKDLGKAYRLYCESRTEYEEAIKDEKSRLREISFLEYELNEITSANISIKDDVNLEERFKKLENSNTIRETLQLIHDFTGYNKEEAVGNLLGQMIKQIGKIAAYDDEIGSLSEQLIDIESLLNDFNKDISLYIQEIEDDFGMLDLIRDRLDLINTLKSKYGKSLDDILSYCDSIKLKLSKYKDYDLYLENLKNDLHDKEKVVKNLSDKLSSIRVIQAKKLTQEIKKALEFLNFNHIRLEMQFEKSANFSPNGYDRAEFLISTNMGEELKALTKIASGGELSRIMLGIKTVIADKDSVETLIFDEIDAGISGRTAQKVSEQLALISKRHQVICITHLAQIAAMADAHYIIEKQSDSSSTETRITYLNNDESIDELARIIGGVLITERTRESAIEMKDLALKLKTKKNKK